MQVERVPIDLLTEDPRNARKHDARNLDAIKASLTRFGQVEPLVVRADTGVVVGGNGRLAAMRSLGWTEVDAVGVELDDVGAAALGIALNRTAELATWDQPMLAELLSDIAGAGVDIQEATALGLDGLLGDVALGDLGFLGEDGLPVAPRVVEDPPAPPPPADPVTRLGDVWTLGRHRLVCGDATLEVVADAALAGLVPNLLVTDPPYGVEYDPTWREEYDQFERHSVGPVINDHQVDWAAAYKYFAGSVAYVWHAGVHAGAVAAGLAGVGFQIRAQIIWAKQHFVFGRGAYHWKHEPCWYAVRKGSNASWIGDRKQITVWDIPNANPMGGEVDDENTRHSTQKPVECMARPMRNHGGDVYDPFIGSGTTLIAAEQLDRVCHGVEIDPGYCDVVVQRWEELTGGKATR